MKTFRCELCKKKFTSQEGLHIHLEKNHRDEFPKNLKDGGRMAFFLRNGKTHGSCIICGSETKWNEKTYKYYRICDKPECKKTMRERYKKNMNKAGKSLSFISDPEFQRKLLRSRRMAGNYKFEDGGMVGYYGSFERRFLEFLDKVLGWNSSDIFSPAPITVAYKYKGKDHFYIPDFYIDSLDVIVEIKDGGNRPNANPEYAKVKAKEKYKDKAMLDYPYSFVKIYNNNFNTFLAFLVEKKKQTITARRGERTKPIYMVEDVIGKEYKFRKKIYDEIENALIEAENDENVNESTILVEFDIANLAPIVKSDNILKKSYYSDYRDRYETLKDRIFQSKKDMDREDAILKATFNGSENIPEEILTKMKKQYEESVNLHKRIKNNYLKEIEKMALLVEEIEKIENNGYPIYTNTDIKYITKETCPRGFFFMNERLQEIVWNSIIWKENLPYRERVSCLIFSEDKTQIFMQLTDDEMGYRVPGGSTEPFYSDEEQVLKECQEEARITVKEIVGPHSITNREWKKQGDYNNFVYHGVIDKNYSAIYNSKYEGFVKIMDRDDNMTNYGKFYNIKEVYNKLTPSHKKIVDSYIIR